MGPPKKNCARNYSPPKMGTAKGLISLRIGTAWWWDRSFKACGVLAPSGTPNTTFGKETLHMTRKVYVIPIFQNRYIDKNASIILGSPIPTFKFGCGDQFYADMSASGGGHVAVFYSIANDYSGPFIEPGTASIIGIQKSSIGSASLDFHPAFAPVLSRYMRFKAKELGASPVMLSMNLIVNRA